MDVLLENVPHLVPRKEMLEDWFKPDEQQLGLWKELYGGGLLIVLCCLCC